MDMSFLGRKKAKLKPQEELFKDDLIIESTKRKENGSLAEDHSGWVKKDPIPVTKNLLPMLTDHYMKNPKNMQIPVKEISLPVKKQNRGTISEF